MLCVRVRALPILCQVNIRSGSESRSIPTQASCWIQTENRPVPKLVPAGYRRKTGRMPVDQPPATELLETLSRHGLAVSAQRLALLSLIRAAEGVHSSADELYRVLAGQFPTLSRATVYNNLAALAAAGIIEKLDTPDGSRYGPVARPHVNLICQHCGQIQDVLIEDEALAAIVVRAGKAGSFRPRTVSVSVSGSCASCA